MKRIVAEQALEISLMKDLQKETSDPARRRAAVQYLVRRRKVSERLACKVVGQPSVNSNVKGSQLR